MDYQPKEKYKRKLELKDLKKEGTKTFKKVSCPACETAIPATDMNIHDKIAKCSSCDALFPLTEEIASFVTKEGAKQEVIRPEGIDIFHFQEELDITIKQPMTSFDNLLLFLSMVFLLVLEFYFIVSYSFWWPTIFGIIGFFGIFNFLSRSKHKLHINIDDRQLIIKYRPKKFIKDKNYDVQDIDQIYVNKHLGVSMIINGVDGQKHVVLIPKVSSLSKAKYLEQEIEKHLGIIDREVLEAIN